MKYLFFIRKCNGYTFNNKLISLALTSFENVEGPNQREAVPSCEASFAILESFSFSSLFFIRF